ncbi:hypothetical protein BDR07DRAFT_1376825 [Suillus spraguei]|nr:hypothetical protein BDR07DRAFT_1376825 [Suillus spraguei]
MVYYMYFDNSNDRKANAAASTTNTQVASSFFSNVFFTLPPDNGGLSFIPVLDFADHVSGSSFFIRSRVSPNECWYCPGLFTGKVYVSHTEQTRFRVRLVNERMDTTGTMIGSDDIIIILTSVNVSVRVCRSTHLIISKSSELGLKFSDLVNEFGVVDSLLDNEGHCENAKNCSRQMMGKSGNSLELVSFDVDKHLREAGSYFYDGSHVNSFCTYKSTPDDVTC